VHAAEPVHEGHHRWGVEGQVHCGGGASGKKDIAISEA
jgi:hypothetical protein